MNLEERKKQEEKNLAERIQTHNQLLNQRSRIDQLLNENQAAMLLLQGRIQILEELLDNSAGEDTDEPDREE